MDDLLDVHGEPLAPESIRMLAYLKARAAEMSVAQIRERIRAAAQELEGVAAAVDPADARRRPVDGKWNIAEVVDHISQTQIRGTEELRHLLAGRRPPLPPVYEGIQSGAGKWAPWQVLAAELHAANQAMVTLLEAVNEEPPSSPTVKTLVVTLRATADGASAAQLYLAELDFKEYALLQRLHLLDHRTQIKKLRASLATSAQAEGTAGSVPLTESFSEPESA
jgi:DinB superfamily